MMRKIHACMAFWKLEPSCRGGGGDSILDGCLQRRCTIFLTDIGRERERDSRFHIYPTHSAPLPPIYLSYPCKTRQPPHNPHNNRHARQPHHDGPEQRHAQTAQRRGARIPDEQQRRGDRAAVGPHGDAAGDVVVLGDAQRGEQGGAEEDGEDAAHDAQDGDELGVAGEVAGGRGGEGEGEGAGGEGEGAGGGEAEGAVAEGRVGEQGGGGGEEGGQGDGGEVAGQFGAVVEHGEGEGDDGDVEDGAQDVAGAGEGEGGGPAVGGVEELGVARFGAVGFEGGGEGGAG